MSLKCNKCPSDFAVKSEFHYTITMRSQLELSLFIFSLEVGISKCKQHRLVFGECVLLGHITPESIDVPAGKNRGNPDVHSCTRNGGFATPFGPGSMSIFISIRLCLAATCKVVIVLMLCCGSIL